MDITRIIRSWKFMGITGMTLVFGAIFYHYRKHGYSLSGENLLPYGGAVLFSLGWIISLWKLSRLEKRRRRKEIALQDRDALIHAIMDGGKHAIVIADRHQTIKSFNR